MAAVAALDERFKDLKRQLQDNTGVLYVEGLLVRYEYSIHVYYDAYL